MKKEFLLPFVALAVQKRKMKYGQVLLPTPPSQIAEKPDFSNIHYFTMLIAHIFQLGAQGKCRRQEGAPLSGNAVRASDLDSVTWTV